MYWYDHYNLTFPEAKPDGVASTARANAAISAASASSIVANVGALPKTPM
jgi:hypothetical protein